MKNSVVGWTWSENYNMNPNIEDLKKWINMNVQTYNNDLWF